MTTTVRVNWSREFDNKLMWNEVCAWAVERFGLPGDRFTTCVNVNYMEFIFVDYRDALLMGLRWNAPIIDDRQLTMDLVSSKFG